MALNAERSGAFRCAAPLAAVCLSLLATFLGCSDRNVKDKAERYGGAVLGLTNTHAQESYSHVGYYSYIDSELMQRAFEERRGSAEMAARQDAALLEMLNDPDRFVAAHVLLRYWYGGACSGDGMSFPVDMYMIHDTTLDAERVDGPRLVFDKALQPAVSAYWRERLRIERELAQRVSTRVDTGPEILLRRK